MRPVAHVSMTFVVNVEAYPTQFHARCWCGSLRDHWPPGRQAPIHSPPLAHTPQARFPLPPGTKTHTCFSFTIILLYIYIINARCFDIKSSVLSLLPIGDLYISKALYSSCCKAVSSWFSGREGDSAIKINSIKKLFTKCFLLWHGLFIIREGGQSNKNKFHQKLLQKIFFSWHGLRKNYKNFWQSLVHCNHLTFILFCHVNATMSHI